MVKDGWKEVAKGTLVYVESGMVIRAIVGSGQPGSVYRWDGKNHCYTNACPVIQFFAA